jgi:hypothetical protein
METKPPVSKKQLITKEFAKLLNENYNKPDILWSRKL